MLEQYLYHLGDNALVLGHRLSELCGHGPTLETDIALTNISLDLFGQVRNYFQYAAKVGEGDKTEDDIAFLRYSHEYKNVLLVEQPNTHFGFVIARQYFFDAYHRLLLEHLRQSPDEQLAAIAEKSIKEVNYHHRFSSEWMKRLGAGTAESKAKMQEAVDHLYPYTKELFAESPVEKEMKEFGVGADLAELEAAYYLEIKGLMQAAELQVPEDGWQRGGGKQGIHSEHFGYILADLQYMQRAYPQMQW
ncbi:MAG: 1,2-phenylacetyl-CoA epoxidase subunit PaaC [Bacteroidota bacterium]